jgi:hypothetical protein
VNSVALFTYFIFLLMQKIKELNSGLVWLLPAVVSAAWEAEIRRIMFHGQPGHKVRKIPSQ